jgi:hypothetical protein
MNKFLVNKWLLFFSVPFGDKRTIHVVSTIHFTRSVIIGCISGPKKSPIKCIDEPLSHSVLKAYGRCTSAQF